jgi:hypothetical protein
LWGRRNLDSATTLAAANEPRDRNDANAADDGATVLVEQPSWSWRREQQVAFFGFFFIFHTYYYY